MSKSFGGLLEGWQEQTGQWVFHSKTWQLVVSASDKVLIEDVPSEVANLLPGISYLTQINLEGKTTKQAFTLLRTAAKEIARSTHGAILDPQEDSVRLPTGVTRYLRPPREDTTDLIALSWWFLDSPLLADGELDALLSLMERMLPEALPKRYGLYEPPQHVYANTGKAHFLEFLRENLRDIFVWYPHRPVASVYVSIPERLGAYPLGFRANRIAIEVERNVLNQPGWDINLRTFWERASGLIRPIYGDVRVLRGYAFRGAGVFSTRNSEEHPVKGWWWAGIPKTLGNAAVLGGVYQERWPEFLAAARVIDGLAFASMEDWALGGDLTEVVGAPPQEQMQPEEPSWGEKRIYPSGWPFGDPFV